MAQRVHFKNSPLNEVVLGFQFSDAQWDISSYGLYAERIRKRFPTNKIVMPLTPLNSSEGFKFLTGPELPRIWYQDRDPAFLLQVQPDRFIFNWRVQPTGSSYPHFDFFYKRFRDEWEQFNSFCLDTQIGKPKPQTFELTYLNHLLKNKDWSTPKDLTRLFSHLGGLDQFEKVNNFGIDLNYEVNGFKIRQSLKTAERLADNEPMIVLEMTCVDRIASNDDAEKRIKAANLALVDSFLKITTKEAQALWGRTDA